MTVPSIPSYESFAKHKNVRQNPSAVQFNSLVGALKHHFWDFLHLSLSQSLSAAVKIVIHLTCCRLGVDEIEAAIWRGVSLGDSTDEDDDELLSYWWRKLSVLHAITCETSIDDGMADTCDVSVVYGEYSKGFVIAMSELRISGVLGVFEPKSIPTPSIGGVESDVLKLYIFHTFSFSASMQPCCLCARFRVKQMTFHKFSVIFWLFCVATKNICKKKTNEPLESLWQFFFVYCEVKKVKWKKMSRVCVWMDMGFQTEL